MKTLVEENVQKWDRRAKSYDRRRFDYFRYMQKKAIAQMKIGDNMRFLDLGCGTGWAVRYLSGLAHGKGDFLGIDISPEMIGKAVINAGGTGNARFLIANAEDLPFSSDYFDSVLCTNSFHHYPDPDRVLREIFRVLKTGGRIHILDVTADDSLLRWINRRVQKKEKAHVSFYSTSAYDGMFSKSGLKHIRSKRLAYPLKLHIAEK
jgi:ubiquinone/menaquinone biosynthesis C-methylase UbiE